MTACDEGLVLDHGITIRRARTIAEYVGCQGVQRSAWGITEGGYLVPVATMVGANLHGGLVLGAFLSSGEAVGMSFAFLGRIDGRLCLYSQLTGVVPGYQSHGIGYQIKQVQRAFARSEGIDVVAWAFDPLQGGNAHFNLCRLGATARRYIENMYGQRTDALNDGVPTDRLIAEWETESTASRETPSELPGTLPKLIGLNPVAPSTEAGSVALPCFLGESSLGPPRTLLEIPSEIALLRRESPALAEAWRAAARHAFCSAFAAGYRAVSILRDDADAGGHRRVFYVLERL
jgi:predicted GNAT superfamily acetyltransferase